MKKFVQSFWGRFLVVLLCTITVMTGIASGLLTIALATMGNKEQYYKNRQQDIAENYAAYLYDQIYRGEENIDKTIARIENFLNDKNFTCSIGKVIGGDTGAEVLLYNNLEVASEWDYEIDFTSDSYVCYNVENALDAIRTNPYMEHGFAITDGIIEEYVFEEETGLFYYKSGTHYFLADYIVVSKDGENYDYSLKNTEDGKKVYCNSYYGITLDTMDYRAWDWVKMGDQKLLMNLDDLKAVNEIEIITDGSIQTKVYTGVYYECVGNYISYYKERTADVYVIRMNVEDDFSHIATVSDDMFYEWKVLWDDFLANETSYKVFLILSVVGLLFGMGLLIYSANSDKEHIEFLQKVPVGIFTLFIASIKALSKSKLLIFFSFN